MGIRDEVCLRFQVALAAVVFVSGCSPKVVVGTWTWACAGTTNAPDAVIDGATDDAGGSTDGGAPIPLPWSSSFEDGFCGYQEAKGFCYTRGGSYEIVQSPVHSGRFAAAYAVDSSLQNGAQARCFREGALPSEAYYGAWYFIPLLQMNTDNWNLFHFAGGAGPGPGLHGLWDVSLVNAPGGNLRLKVFDFFTSASLDGTGAAPPPVPIGSWFHIQFFMRRAADATGEITLYQDGAVLYHAVDIVTDDTPFGQWYVGNLASEDALTPSNSIVYVDDVEISETR